MSDMLTELVPGQTEPADLELLQVLVVYENIWELASVLIQTTRSNQVHCDPNLGINAKI